MALPRSNSELQQLKQKLETLVLGRDLISLSTVSFLPCGPETTGFDSEPSFYGTIPVSTEDEESSHDDHDDNSTSSHEKNNLESLNVSVNRYAGVIYAARFFVTRVGFLRSVKRLLVLSSNHLTIVDPYSEQVKERYAFDNIKEITIASDSGGHSADRAFTVFIGKNIKETYTCRCRQQLLSAYYQLRERASAFRKDQIDAATADALSAVGASVASSDSSYWTTSGSSGTPGGPSNFSSLGTSGMYFDSLFQLCGKTFTVKKLSTTRSVALHPVKLDVLLAVRAASLDRLEPDTRTTLSSILLIDIVKIQRVSINSNELVLYFENNRVHRYWCDSREPFIQAIANNLRSWLSVSLFVEEVSDSYEFDALTSTRDIPQPVTFEIPVLKISKNKSDKLQLRLLGLTALAIVERDPVTRKTMASHALNDIFNVVMYPSVSSSLDDLETEASQGLCGKFALELKRGRTRRYVCLSAAVNRRDKDVSLGLQWVSSQHENELCQVIGDIAGDIDAPAWLQVAGSSTLLSPKEVRSLFLSNMMEMCRMNKLHLPWSTEETEIACKEGTWGTEVHSEWEDILLRKLASLSLIPNLVSNESMSIIYNQIVQFNRNIPLGGLRQRDRRAFASLMKLLENFKVYSVAQLNSPSNTDAPIPTTEFQVELLLAIQRLLCTRGVFEEIPSSQYKRSIEVIIELLHSPMEEVSFAASCVIKYMVINYSDTRSLKSETANRRAIFTKYHSRMYVSRAFDLSRTNRAGRLPLHSANLARTESSRAQSVATMSNTERSMANALAYSQLGLDYLVLGTVLQTLEVCLSSGKKATPERVARDLLRAMRFNDFSRHHALFLFNRSLSFSITKSSSILVKVHILEQPTELVELIQDFARKHGALIWQLYLALYTQDKAQRRISSQLVALLTHENPRSSYVIRNIFPHALLDDMKTTQLEFDEFGRHLPTANPETYPKNNDASHKHGGRRDTTSAAESRRNKLSFGINTRARLARHVKHAVLLPEFFDRLSKTHTTKDLVWGPNAVEELICRLQAEISALDLYRLKYLGYLYTDPLATDHTETEWDAHQTNRLCHDPQNATFAPFLFEFLQNGLESQLALEIMKGTISSSNRFARYMPLSFLLNPDTSEDVESDGGLDDDGYDSDDNYTDENGCASRPSGTRAGHGAALKHDDEDDSHAGLRSAFSSKKKKRSAKNMPRWFVAWNCNEFCIDYECLKSEVKVGPYYLANILDDRGVLVEGIEGAEKFMSLLYYRLLAEDRGISINNVQNVEWCSSLDAQGDIDQCDIRLLVLKVMIQVYERHCTELGSLTFLNHLLRVSMMKTRGGEVRCWPLVVRGNIMLFLDRVLSSAVNVSRFSRENDNVTMALDLLREVKPLVVLQGPTDSEKEYVVEPPVDIQADLDASEDENEDVYDEDDEDYGHDRIEHDDVNSDEEEDDRDITKRMIDALEDSGGESSVASSHSNSLTDVHPDDDSVQLEEEPRRVTVVAEHCGAMSSSMIMQTCLSVLSRLVDCHTAEEEGYMYQDVRFPKYGRLTHFEGSSVSPISSIKQRLCEDQTLRFLVGLLDCPNRIVFKKCLGLIRLLVRHNEAIIPNLHASGIFYYLLRFAQDVDEMSIAARLISHIHLRQSGLEFPHLVDDKQKGENKKGIFAPDPLTRICLRSWLVRVLPVSMVAQLLRHGPRRFATALFSDANNPEVVWNANMRNQMVAYVEKFMNLHTDESGMFYISKNEGSEHKACIPLIKYPKEVHALQCYQYYLHNLLDEKNFPGWPINDEAAFLRALLDSIRRWVHPGSLPSTRGAVNDQSTKLLSVFDAVELLDATALLVRRFPDSPNITNLHNISYFLEALERCITELKANRVGRTKPFFDVSKAIAAKTAFVKAFSSAIRVINLAVAASDENARGGSSGLGLRVLCNSLQLLFHNQGALNAVDGCAPNVITHWVLEALVNVLNQPNGRVSAAAQSIDLLPCLTRYLSQEGDRLATDLSLQIMYEMAGSSGEMAEVLLLQLAEHGIVWYLTLLLFHYRPNNDGNNGELQRISIGAAKALGRILEANAKEDSIAVFVKRMQTTIEQIFTRPLVDILRRAGPIKILDVLVTEVREPHVMWTDRMRKELISLARRAIQFHTTIDQSDGEAHKVFELPSHFKYSAQKEELCVAGIYVNFFNENPKNGILAQIAGTENSGGRRAEMLKQKPGTKKEIQAAAAAAAELENRNVSGHVMHGLLAALSYDISGVRSQPQALESVLLQRLLPVATAIRNLLQYTPDMDVQVVQADGLVTLLYVLDHETQPQGYSFANAPLLLLRCMECVHTLSFSGKCVDPLAKAVPPFIKSAFQVVYKNLARTEASTEGQLARITLQLLGNLCLIPACIDNLVKGMDPVSLSNLLPHVWLGDSTEMQLLLCLHMIPLKRHTQAATEFAKAAVSSQLAAALLNLLSTLMPKSKVGESTATKQYAARFLSVLSSNPGSGGAISSLLIASRVWETHGDTTQATSEDLRRLLMPPYAPALLKAPHANPNKVG
uniref:DnaJ homologue subfamily C GRV2/DNAJC13 N-terminal domain-containing protein n=1 Tax=Hyaloperonospora arabidopsidis (strain Emoy2) TaxID=559515 RepID=M4BVV8_HYAAE